jgi:hypothetical protein
MDPFIGILVSFSGSKNWFILLTFSNSLSVRFVIYAMYAACQSHLTLHHIILLYKDMIAFNQATVAQKRLVFMLN